MFFGSISARFSRGFLKRSEGFKEFLWLDVFCDFQDARRDRGTIAALGNGDRCQGFCGGFCDPDCELDFSDRRESARHCTMIGCARTFSQFAN